MTAYNVGSLADLRTALAESATNGQADVITLTASLSVTSGAGSVAGTGGPDILRIAITDGQTLSILGGGHTLGVNYFGRALEVSSGTVSISDLTIREGMAAGDGGDYSVSGGAGLGAGIYNSANLTLTNVTVTASVASGGGGGGGGGYTVGGGGGGGGIGPLAGAGGAGYDGGSAIGYPGGAASWGLGGDGGGPVAGLGAAGGSSTGGAGAPGPGGTSHGGAGGTATVGGLSVGGGGGGSGDYSGQGAGGAAVGGIFNSGILLLTGSTVSGNIAAGGGGGGGDSYNFGANGGAATGGIRNTGTLILDGSSVTGNVASGGLAGHDYRGFGVNGVATNNIESPAYNLLHTGGASLAGTATQGQVLTASNTLADGNTLGAISYQWKSDGATITGATGATLTLAQAQVGHVVTVTASYVDGAGFAESATSSGTASVANINDAPTGAATIAGTATQGQVLTASNTLADADGLGSISYQWKSDGANISGATSSTFTLAPAQVGHVVTVAASYTDGGGAVEQVTSAATSAVSAPAGPTASVATLAELKAALAAAATDGVANVITITADISATSSADFAAGTGGRDLLKIAVTDSQTLTIVGGGHILDANSWGRALEVSGGTVAISDLTIREGALAGDGGGNHLAGGSALGAGIYNTGDLTLTNVIVTANGATGGGGGGGGDGSSYSGGGGGGGGLGAFAGSGGAGASQGDGETYPGGAASGGHGGAGGTASQYTSGGAGGSSTGGAGGTYVTSNAFGGAGATATVGGLSLGGGGGGAAVGSSPGAGGSAVGGIFNSGTLYLSGGSVSGNLAAGGGGGGTQNGPGGAGGAAVGGVKNTGALTLDSASITGNAAGVSAGGGIGNGAGIAAAGAATNDLLGGVNHAHTGGVSLSGAATLGQTLNASNTLADADGLGTISYVWKADGSAIGGATASSYTLTSGELGKHISVTASYVDGGGASESATSTAGAAVTSPVAPPDPGPPAPVTSGTTVDGAAVSTTTTTAADGSQTHTIVVDPLTAARPDSTGGATTADIPLVTVNGEHLITVGLPTGTGLSASGSTAPRAASAAQPGFIRDIDAGASTADRGQMGDGANAFLQDHSTAPVLVQTLTLSGAHTDTAIAINGSTLGSGVTTALVIDTHNLSGQTQLTLDNVDFAAVIGAVHITGGAGSQTVFADGAQQYMVLGADNDQLHGGGGNDTVGSAGGDDSLYGDDGADSVFGGIGLDAVNGGSGDDVVQGNQGDDLVQGNAGNDRVYGGQGNDIVHGGQGDDQVWGDLGDDLILGDRGNDTLTGGAGADTFIFEAGHGADRITDFRQAEGDHIQLAAGHGAYTTAQVGADTVLDFGAGDSIRLANVQMATLTSGWVLG